MSVKRQRRKRRRRKRIRVGRLVLYLAVLAALMTAVGLALPEREAEAGGKTAARGTESVSEESSLSGIWKESQTSMRQFSGQKTEDRGDWNLILVNFENPIPYDYQVRLAALDGGHQVDERCYDDLMQMIGDCRAQGLSPVICSAYRTMQKQQELYEEKIRELMADGYEREEAGEIAATSVAVPGTSEHQLGLAVDIVDESYQLLDRAQERTQVQKWLMENSYRYGFILRYPNDKSDLTGIIYEPWHYRYVGKEAAEEIYRQGVCLEEYLASFGK